MLVGVHDRQTWFRFRDDYSPAPSSWKGSLTGTAQQTGRHCQTGLTQYVAAIH
jgi:hypothetical protein